MKHGKNMNQNDEPKFTLMNKGWYKKLRAYIKGTVTH